MLQGVLDTNQGMDSRPYKHCFEKASRGQGKLKHCWHKPHMSKSTWLPAGCRTHGTIPVLHIFPHRLHKMSRITHSLDVPQVWSTLRYAVHQPCAAGSPRCRAQSSYKPRIPAPNNKFAHVRLPTDGASTPSSRIYESCP
jgi:hypothetical protein